MPTSEKIAAVAELKQQFTQAGAALVTEYRGLTVAEITQLRRSLGADTTYVVAKNTLAKRAASEAGISGLDDLFVDSTAIAFIRGEAVDAAKVFKEFSKDHEHLVIKGGYMEGNPLSAEQVKQLADMESREVLLAKLAGAMQANMAKAAALFQAPASKMARLAAALHEKNGESEAA